MSQQSGSQGKWTSILRCFRATRTITFGWASSSPGGRLPVIVTDCGAGMEQEHCSHIESVVGDLLSPLESA